MVFLFLYLFIIDTAYHRARERSFYSKTCCCFHQHIKLSVELFQAASELFFFPYNSSQCNVQSIYCNHSLLVIYAHRWFIMFAHFITSLTFLFEFTDRSVPKTLTIIFECGPTVNGVWMCMRSEHCLGPVSKHEFPSSTWFKCDRSSLRNIKCWNWNAFQSRLFYSSDRKYWGDRRQVKGAFYKRLTTQSIFPVF